MMYPGQSDDVWTWSRSILFRLESYGSRTTTVACPLLKTGDGQTPLARVLSYLKDHRKHLTHL